MNEEFVQLAQYLKSRTGKRPFHYLPHLEGNWGDALIAYGSLKFLNEFGIPYRIRRQSKLDWLLPILTGGTAIYGASGAWCQFYDYPAHFVRRLSRFFPMIVMPSTYQSHYSIPRTTFFSRDRYESLQSMPESTFCHDMAFFIGDEFKTSDPGSGVGYFFRTDAESAAKIKLPSNNWDISAAGNNNSNVPKFFEHIAKYSVIYTDRLHVSIAACLLGREVHLYPGAYFKNKSIFRSSIEGNFPNAHFHEEFDF
ncbi:polysaccharide pyruvyl transferase family protein [Cerasicoccus frondis]|uniref:polysaccharide pyruvyl transferase family protein n=1 Tax=Cerasicoccus frondis TaxID=490090 RepID=UPI0028525BB0|nr:polysaccharide pyruvyl transferase family protein [Cerasicoccus frondis]